MLAIGALELNNSLVNSQWLASHQLGLFLILGLTMRVQFLLSHGREEDINNIKDGLQSLSVWQPRRSISKLSQITLRTVLSRHIGGFFQGEVSAKLSIQIAVPIFSELINNYGNYSHPAPRTLSILFISCSMTGLNRNLTLQAFLTSVGSGKQQSKSVKSHLKRTIGDTLLTSEELSTILSHIEAVLNSRPLEPLSEDPDDLTASTPGHFLIGEAQAPVPEPSLDEGNLSRLSRWQLIQQKLQSFRNYWSSGYLQQLQSTLK